MRRENFNPFEVTGGSRKKNYYLNRRYGSKSFSVDVFQDQKQSSAKKSNNTLGLIVEPKLLTLWLVVLFFGIFVLTARTAFLQIAQGDHFSEVAEGNRIRVIDIKAPRGVIYDRHQNLLLENVSSFALAVTPVDLPKDEGELRQLAIELSEVADMSSEDIFELLDTQSAYSYQSVIIKENLSHDEAIMVEILNSRYPGVILKSSSLRRYLTTNYLNSLSHVLGYIGKIEESRKAEYLEKGYLIDDYVGKAGIELSYEDELKGVNGKQTVEVDATGDAKEVLASKEPVSGNNLVLTIDSELQRVAEESLSRVLEKNGKKRGAVVIMEPNSGEILSLISLPAFDNNLFSQGISSEDFTKLINDPDRPLFSRAIAGEYPSGSTFKLIVSAAALEENIITPNTGFNSVGGIAVSRWFFPDWKAGGHGYTNLSKALAESVNTFYYMIGGGYNDFVGLGVDKITAYAKEFGLSKVLGIDLPNEADGFLPSKEWKEETKQERWYIGDTYNLSIGQGDVLVTPLQVASWTAVFASGGTLFKPYVVKEILDSNNNLVSEIKPVVLNKDFISPQNIEAVNKGLRQAVVSGSAVRLSTLPINVAAKTGTAQWSSNKEPHAWMTAFAPYEEPQIVVTVLVEEGEGGTITAAPVVYDILNWWANNR